MRIGDFERAGYFISKQKVKVNATANISNLYCVVSGKTTFMLITKFDCTLYSFFNLRSSLMTIPLVLHEANPGHHFQVGTLLQVNSNFLMR